jgi:phospholipid transport system substrate-binding protein
MMTRFGWFAAAIVFLAVGMFAGRAAALTVEAPAGSGDAIASVKTIVDQSVVVFKQKDLAEDVRQQKLRAIAESHFDFTQMAQSACGYHWRTFTPEQKAQFVPLFTKFIEDVYLCQISKEGGEWKIYDITIDAISVMANYRNQFNRVLNNDGYDKLVSIMRQKMQNLQQPAT